MAISSTSANEPRGLAPAAVHTHRCVLLAPCLRHGNGGHEVECEWRRKAAHQEGCKGPDKEGATSHWPGASNQQFYRSCTEFHRCRLLIFLTGCMSGSPQLIELPT